MITMFKQWLNFFYARREDTKMGIKILQILILVLELVKEILEILN